MFYIAEITYIHDSYGAKLIKRVIFQLTLTAEIDTKMQSSRCKNILKLPYESELANMKPLEKRTPYTLCMSVLSTTSNSVKKLS